MTMPFPLSPRATVELAGAEIVSPIALEASTGSLLASSPVAVVTVVTAWASSGLIAAYALHRRGHEFRTLAVLGVAFGPLFIGLARTIARRDESVEPLVLHAGWSGDGTIDVLITFDNTPGDDHRTVALLALLGSVGRVTLARTIDFESARDHNWSDAKSTAAADLATRVQRFARYEPATVLVPGPASTAATRYAARAGYDVLVVAGGSRSPLLRSRRARAALEGVTAMIPPAPPPVEPVGSRRAGTVMPRSLPQ